MDPSFQYLEDFSKQLNDLKSDFRNPNLYRFLLSYVKGPDLLDVGCGAGHFLAVARQAGFSVAGMEPNTKLIELSRELYQVDLNIYPLYAEQIGQIQRQFDTITLIDVLEHIDNDAHLLEHLRNFLKDDGRLIILVPHHPHLYGKRDELSGHFRRYSAKDLIKKLRTNGFTVEHARLWNMLGYVPYLISERILRKPLDTSLRQNKDIKGRPLKRLLSRSLGVWFRHIENNINFGFGLSLLCVAKKAGRDLAGGR